jgi:hypothetical protein
MAGGGTAPPLKISDVFLLIGVTLIVGTLFIQEWDQPVKINGDDGLFEGTSQSFSGDIIEIKVTVENESEVRIQIFEDGEEVEDEKAIVSAGGDLETNHKSDGGELEWIVTLEAGVDGEVDVDLSRANGLNFLPYLLGLALGGYGLYRRNSDSVEEEEILDAIIEVEDQAKED